MYRQRVIGQAVKWVQMYFKVQTNNTVKKLVEKELQYCKDNNMNATTKNTELEHTQKVRFITGVHLKMMSATWYKV